jgi:thioredoxin reductase (NADPH)
VILVHRNSSFRGHLDSVQKVIDLAQNGVIELITEAEVVGLSGKDALESVIIHHQKDGEIVKNTDHFITII